MARVVKYVIVRQLLMMNMYVVFRHAETEFRKVFTKDLSGSRKINIWLLRVLNIIGAFIAILFFF